MALYFRVSDRRECTADEALDARGVLRHGYGQRVPHSMRDGFSRLTDARAFWDQNHDALLVTDARAIGGVEGCRPGFRIFDCDVGRQAKLDAYEQYEAELTSAYRNPPRDAASGEGERGARGSQEGDLCMCSGPDDEGPQGAAGHLVRRDGDLICRADDEEQYSADSMTVDAMNATHQKNMSRIYDQIAADVSQQWRRDK